MWCPQGSLSGTQGMPAFVGLAGRGLSRRPLSKAVKYHIWQLKTKSRMWKLQAQKAWAQDSTTSTQC